MTPRIAPSSTPPTSTTTTVEALRADPHNRRLHPPRNVEMIATALKEVGAARSIVIDEDDLVLAGNGVMAAAGAAGISAVRVVEARGDEIIAVRRRDLTPEQKRALAIYDNRTAELAEWNVAQLEQDKAGDLGLRPFWTSAEEARLIGRGLKAGATDPDSVPVPRATTIKRGDCFALGGHRVLCGDSTNADDLAVLMGAGMGDALFTSPPYNVGVNYAASDDSPQAHVDYFGWLTELSRLWSSRLLDGRAFIWNVGVSPKTAPHQHVAMLERVGLTFVRQFIWHKVGVPVPTFHATRSNPCVRRLTSNYTHEMVFVMTTDDELAVGAVQALRNDVLEHDVFTVHQTLATVDLPAGDQRTGVQSNLDRRSMKAHPAAFPVALVVAFLQHYIGLDEVVLEPFNGSGSTLIACEQLGARCFGMDVAPEYVQVTIDRWEAFTGQKAQAVVAP